MAGLGHVAQDLGEAGRHLADGEEGRLDALVGEGAQDRVRVAHLGSVVEGQHDFLEAQEIVFLVVLEPPRPPVVSISTVRETPSALGLAHEPGPLRERRSGADHARKEQNL